jgi:hypothetical protein
MSSSVRTKTQQHLRRLVTAAAVASTVGAAEACRSGYAVVDPMPTPSRCQGAAASLSATARWIDTPAGRRIELVVAKPTSPSFALGKLAEARWGADAPDETTETDTGFRFVLLPKNGFEFSLAIPVRCSDGSDAGASAEVQIDVQMVDADALRVDLHDID